MTTSIRRRALAAGTVLGIVCAIVGVSAASAATIDGSRQGRITVHKFANPGNGDQNAAGTGTDPDTAPVAGVVFEYCAIGGIDLLDGGNAGWSALRGITPAAKQAAAAADTTTLAGYTLTGCTRLPATDATGTAASPSLPLGAYFVREVSAPSNVVAPAAPFIVTLPTPADAGRLDGDWVYSVNVYPKNTIAQGPSKNVVDQPAAGAVLGAPIHYEVTQLIPALAPGEAYTTFAMTDTLDGRLTPSTTVPVTVTAGSIAFAAGTDYTAGWSGQTLTVTFTAAGLAKLQAGQNVVFAFQATANAPGSIDNTAFVDLNHLTLTPGKPNGSVGSPSSTATTRWGDLTVQKVNAADAADGLGGARFQLYQGTTDDPAGCAADISGLRQVTAPGTSDPYEVTSDGSGSIVIPGLWVGDTERTVAADGTVTDTTVAGHDLQRRCYVLREVAAPAGFVLPTGQAALTPVMVKAGQNGAVPLVKIQNTQQGVPQLPFTGSDVQRALTIGGIALLAVAAGGVLIVRRRGARARVVTAADGSASAGPAPESRTL